LAGRRVSFFEPTRTLAAENAANRGNSSQIDPIADAVSSPIDEMAAEQYENDRPRIEVITGGAA